jgi:GTP-binding protein
MASVETGAELEKAALLESGRRLFAARCEFLRGVTDLEVLPEPVLPEVALAGRSNVGKSSLLNALLGQNNMARVSNTPGRTRQLNFFQLGNALLVADLPGYGYARAPKHEIAHWTKLTRDYLRGRSNLRRVLLLIDARHGIKPPDEAIMAMLDDAAVVFQLVLTKADKVKSSERGALTAHLGKLLSRRPAAHPELLLTSSRTGEGLEILRAQLAALAAKMTGL